jgi:hypothetical protein
LIALIVFATQKLTFSSSLQFNFEELLNESCRSLAAQLTPENFIEVWGIACELKADELKRLVVKYIVDNRGRLNYDQNMSSDLMIEVVRAIT